MALATYADLQGEIASWLRRADLSAEIPTFIALAEAQMNRRLRVRPLRGGQKDSARAKIRSRGPGA